MEASAKPNALLIDDEPDIRTISGMALKLAGWDVRDASNGREGLRLVRELKPDLIVCDVMMSEMSGLEFCHKLVEELHTKDVPVIMISAINERAKVLNDFWELPIIRKEFLHKPFSTEELLGLVKKLMPAGFVSPKPGTLSTPPKPSRPAAPAADSESPAQGSHVPTPPPWLRASAQPQPPAPAPAQPAPRPAAPAVDHRGGYRILVIDDEPDIRMILRAGLGAYHTVEEAENGMIALELLDHFAPDFVISDINMPVMNGLETAEAIRRHPVYFGLPIFFLTGETDKDLPRKAYSVGGNIYLRKPIDPEQLLKYIDYFLKETGLRPGQHGTKTGHKPLITGNTAADVTPAPNPNAVRILIIDFNFENQRLLQRLFGQGGHPCQVQGEPFELLWTQDPRTALGNLARWQPDLILYNPRNPGFDGIAFGQTLLLQREIGRQRVAFIGTRFYDADHDYAQRQWGLAPIALDAPEAHLAQALSQAVAAAREKLRPKDHSYHQIQEEETERLRTLQANSARQARQREAHRERYNSIQEFIDRQF